MDIKSKMNNRFSGLQGGLFLNVSKADVGEGASVFQKAGGDVMAWADMFYPDPSIPESVKKATMEAAAAFINAKYGAGTLELQLRDSYFNMRKCIEPHFYVVERAMKAMEAVGMKPVAVPIRGGTDGARLSYEGLPCPNLCTGGENYHGRFEYIPVEDMEKCVDMLIAILTSL